MLNLTIAAATAFNLVCNGTAERTEYSGSKSEPYSVTYRVDTKARLWCEDDFEACKAPESLADISDLTIKLIDIKADSGSQPFRYVVQINRENGQHQSLMISGSDAKTRIEKLTGVCQPAPFSGFTNVAKKF